MSTRYASHLPASSRQYVNPTHVLDEAQIPGNDSRRDNLGQQPLTVDLEDSIYIFPNPSSIPPSPSGYSDFSAYTDLSPCSPGALSQSDSSASCIFLHENASRHNDATSREVASFRAGATARTSDDSQSDLDWTSLGDDAQFNVATSPVGQKASPSPLRMWPIQATPRSSAQRVYIAHFRSQIERRHHVLDLPREYECMRVRTLSNVTYASLSSSSNAHAVSPHPRIYIPFLSFISVILGLDLDDPALRLLHNSSSDSILFSGQGNLAGIHDIEACLGDSSNTETSQPTSSDSEVHGVARLFVYSDDSRLSTKAIRHALEATSSSLLNITSSVSVPSITSSFFGLCRLVGNVLVNERKAPRQTRTSST
ncbi:hypothetical protein K474DRAFT_1663191 [Panus rudis PR-1116 ss-1]|nr:hypothetical protein K474DRAFT_1663191 [Panus rudis PR-1116 ss-1]